MASSNSTDVCGKLVPSSLTAHRTGMLHASRLFHDFLSPDPIFYAMTASLTQLARDGFRCVDLVHVHLLCFAIAASDSYHACAPSCAFLGYTSDEVLLLHRGKKHALEGPRRLAHVHEKLLVCPNFGGAFHIRADVIFERKNH